MFETFRGTEYGWELGPSLDDGIMRSYIFQLLEGLIRSDVDPRWQAETQKVINDICPDARFGTAMDYAINEIIKWRKFLAIYRGVLKELFALGSHSKATILNRKVTSLRSGKDLIWCPKFNYQTYILNVTDNSVGQAKMHELLQILTDNGVDRFESADEDLKLRILDALKEAEEGKRGFYIACQFAWLPRNREPEQLEAQEYSEECAKFQNSIAGKRAKRLLLENLTEAQEKDYFRHGYFFVVPRNQDCPMHKRRIYVIERSFPNGNILRVKQRKSVGGKWHWYPERTYCFHTEKPHAVDDILLSQKLTLENQEREFLDAANASSPHLEGRAPLATSKRSV